MEKLAKYKLDKSFTEGVDIYLDGAPDVAFKVRLPSQYNRAYSQALYGSMNLTIGDDGKVKADGNLMNTRYCQVDAFIDACLVSIDGESVPDGFANDYPEAVDELMTKANELANSITERVDESVAKLSASASGSGSGQGKPRSMSSLQKEAG